MTTQDPFEQFEMDGVNSEEDVEFISAAEAPSLVDAAAKMSAEENGPDIEDPSDGPVRLPVGFRRRSPGEPVQVVTDAWVRELNGEDEERIAKARAREDFGAYFNSILQAGVERLGNKPPTLDEIRGLTVADREYLLLEISRATYGDDLDYTGVRCPKCEETFDITVHKSEDIPVTRLESPDEDTFEVPLSRDRVATVHLVSGEEQEKISEAETGAEANTIIIAHCVSQIRGPKGTVTFAGSLDAARKLGLRDRQAIMDALTEKSPGPQYNGVRFTHDCGQEISFGVSLADLFRGL